jgi:NADH dehydrogenase
VTALSVAGVDGIWALGDCALISNLDDGKYFPPTTQFADRQEKHLAKKHRQPAANRKNQRIFLSSSEDVCCHRAQ